MVRVIAFLDMCFMGQQTKSKKTGIVTWTANLRFGNIYVAFALSFLFSNQVTVLVFITLIALMVDQKKSLSRGDNTNAARRLNIPNIIVKAKMTILLAV